MSLPRSTRSAAVEPVPTALEADPLPHPGDGPAPKPLTLPAGQLADVLGIREVGYIKGQHALALKEEKLQ